MYQRPRARARACLHVRTGCFTIWVGLSEPTETGNQEMCSERGIGCVTSSLRVAVGLRAPGSDVCCKNRNGIATSGAATEFLSFPLL